MVEQLLAFGAAYNQPSVIFRYFNAAGADPAGDLGEDHTPETHLIPLVLEALAGRRPSVRCSAATAHRRWHLHPVITSTWLIWPPPMSIGLGGCWPRLTSSSTTSARRRRLFRATGD